MKAKTSIVGSEFACTRGGSTIRGTEFRPEGANLPIAIINHGFTQNQKNVMHYARQFAKWGYLAYCFDFAGGALFGKSDGDFGNMSTTSEIQDLKTVIEYAKQQYDIDPKRLVLMGCGHGGLVSALTAAELQGDVSQLVLFYTTLCILKHAKKEEKVIFGFDPQNIFGDIINESRKPRHEAIDIQVLEKMSKYLGPILIIHGAKDKNVPIEHIKKAQENYVSAGAECQLQIIQNVKHEFSKKADQIAIALLQKFLL